MHAARLTMPVGGSDNKLMYQRRAVYYAAAICGSSINNSATVRRWCCSLVLCIITVLASCGSDEAVSAALDEQPDTISRGFRQVTVSRNGRVEVEAKLVEVYNKKNLSVFSAASLREYNSQGNLSIRGSADRIELSGNRDGSAEGRISVQDLSENSTLEAEKLNWNNKERMLSGEGPVTVETGDGLKLQGEGFVADLARETYRFSSGVSGSLVIKD